MVWLPDGEKKLQDIFIPFDMIHERDRRTDRQTDGRTGIATLNGWTTGAATSKPIILHSAHAVVHMT